MDAKKLICVTGAPCSGKTKTLNLMREIVGYFDFHIVQESPTFLSQGENPLHSIPQHGPEQQQFDSLVYHSRKYSAMEAVRRPEPIILFDRGTLDGAVYHENFFEMMRTTREEELKRYSAVILMETMANVGKYCKDGTRWEDASLASEIHTKLQKLYGDHPNFIEIPAKLDSVRRLAMMLDFIDSI